MSRCWPVASVRAPMAPVMSEQCWPGGDEDSVKNAQVSAIITYDHTTRDGLSGFTDHSAILIDLPVSLTAATDDAGVLFSLTEMLGGQEPQPTVSYQPHKTAMARNSPSPFARNVTESLAAKLSVGTLLDHGCGRGSDVAHYRAHGLDADGYDPH